MSISRLSPTDGREDGRRREVDGDAGRAERAGLINESWEFPPLHATATQGLYEEVLYGHARRRRKTLKPPPYFTEPDVRLGQPWLRGQPPSGGAKVHLAEAVGDEARGGDGARAGRPPGAAAAVVLHVRRQVPKVVEAVLQVRQHPCTIGEENGAVIVE